MKEIVIVANAGIVNLLYQANAQSMGPPPAPGQGAAIHFGGLQNVQADPDVPPEIVVIGKKLHGAIQHIGATLVGNSGAPSINLPCLSGQITENEVLALLNRIRFKIVTKNFGPGRAGANHVAKSTGYITIEINDQWLKGYDALAGGLHYIVAHEVGHSSVPVQQAYARLWNQFINGAGKGLTKSQQEAQFPSSPEFAQNEALANSVSREILKNSQSPSLNFTPPHNYAC